MSELTERTFRTLNPQLTRYISTFGPQLLKPKFRRRA
jgi:hypothetical protein